jgi:hypothetical protein
VVVTKSSRGRGRVLRVSTGAVIPRLTGPSASPPSIDQVASVVDAVADLAQRAAGCRLLESTELELDLVSGDNHVSHALGRTPRGVYLTPKTTVAGHAWSFDWEQPGNPHPDRVAVINVTDAVVARLVFF